MADDLLHAFLQSLERERVLPQAALELVHIQSAGGTNALDIIEAYNLGNMEKAGALFSAVIGAQYISTHDLKPRISITSASDAMKNSYAVLANKDDAILSCEYNLQKIQVLRQQYSVVYFCLRQDFVALLCADHSSALTEFALTFHQCSNPLLTANHVFIHKTKCLGILALFLALAALFPLPLFICVLALCNIYYFLCFFFKAILFSIGLFTDAPYHENGEDSNMPVYTLLIPLFKEADILPILAQNINNLNYPKEKLDIKLILEARDTETIAAARQCKFLGCVDIIEVAWSLPQTKPKALNYAIPFIRGEYTVIYDAEDKPDPQQLRKAVYSFRSQTENIACFQARLNFFNDSETFFSAMVSVEYTLWFNFWLNAAGQMHMPLPLGGTSNHLRTDILKEVGGWDPYNVTEDAELGLRLSQRGYRTMLLDSDTFEEASTSFRDWNNQRSRWIKGHLKTWYVFICNIRSFTAATGLKGFSILNLFIGLPYVCLLLNPLFFIIWIIHKMFLIGIPEIYVRMTDFNLVVYNLVSIFMALSALWLTKRKHLLLYALLLPVYWICMIISAFKAVWQLIFNPFYWEKTTHGTSAILAATVQACRK